MAKLDKYKFDSKIHIFRATKRMSQQELADLVGVSRQTIIQLERNRYNPSMLLAYNIAKVFDVVQTGNNHKSNTLSGKEEHVMDSLLKLIILVVFIPGGSCSLAGTWWSRNKKKEEKEEKPQL